MSKPLTLNDIEDLLRLELPETQSRAGWTIEGLAAQYVNDGEFISRIEQEFPNGQGKD